MLTSDASVMRYQISQSVLDYAISYPFWDFSEISVTAAKAATGDSVILKRDVDYTLTVSQPLTDTVFQGGTVSMISDVFKDYDTLVIAREIPLTQDTKLENGESIDSDVLENSLDRIVGQIQQLSEGLGHALQLPITEDPSDIIMPEADQRKNSVLGFGEDGITVKMYPIPEEAVTANEEAKTTLLKIIEINKTIEQNKEESSQMLQQMKGMIHPGYRVTIGDGHTTEFYIKHNLHSEWVQPFCWFSDVSKAGYYVFDEIDEDTLKVTFRTAPEQDGVEIRIIPSQRVEIAELSEELQVNPVNLQDCALTTEEIAEIIKQHTQP